MKYTIARVPQFYVHSLRDQPAFVKTDEDFTPPFLVAEVGDPRFPTRGFLGVALELSPELKPDALLEIAAHWCARLQWRHTVYVVFNNIRAARITPEGACLMVHRGEVEFVVPELDTAARAAVARAATSTTTVTDDESGAE